MGRQVKQADLQIDTPPAPLPVDAPPSAGAPPETSAMPQMPQVRGTPSTAGQQPRRYVVKGGARVGTDGSIQVVYAGHVSRVRLGAVLVENAVDLDALRKQGVVLEEVAS